MASIRLENDYLSQKLKDELEKIEEEQEGGRSVQFQAGMDGCLNTFSKKNLL